MSSDLPNSRRKQHLVSLFLRAISISLALFVCDSSHITSKIHTIPLRFSSISITPNSKQVSRDQFTLNSMGLLHYLCMHLLEQWEKCFFLTFHLGLIRC